MSLLTRTRALLSPIVRKKAAAAPETSLARLLAPPRAEARPGQADAAPDPEQREAAAELPAPAGPAGATAPAPTIDPRGEPAGAGNEDPSAPAAPAVQPAIPLARAPRHRPADPDPTSRMAVSPATVRPWPPERLALALQGGGSFGAFTWGVLDRLLEETDIEFDAASGSSAGAVNAVLLASGMIENGREGARQRLSSFWKRVSQAAALAPPPLTAGLELITRLMSPYQFNPFNLNPLREALEAEVDFERLRASAGIKLLLGATRVRDGSLRILTNAELTVDAVLASACLPLLHHAIELDGEPYWDGGYAANPPLIPLVRVSEASHLLIVQVTPHVSDHLPKTPGEIAARIEQIQFNATLNSELEALKLGMIVGAVDKLRGLRIGRISADDHFERFGAENAANLRWDFLERLFSGGRAAGELWLDQGLPALRRRA